MTAKKRALKTMPEEGRNPKGGLTAKGRAYFRAKEGSNLKAGVKGPADTPEKMHSKGSFLVRFFSHPRGPVQNAKGEPNSFSTQRARLGRACTENSLSSAQIGVERTSPLGEISCGAGETILEESTFCDVGQRPSSSDV